MKEVGGGGGGGGGGQVMALTQLSYLKIACYILLLFMAPWQKLLIIDVHTLQ